MSIDQATWERLLVGTRQHAWASILVRLYRFRRLRKKCRSFALRLEGGRFFSRTYREFLRSYYGVAVGAYSYGECLIPGAFPAGVTVGRYVSIGAGAKVFLRNHPLERLSLHPFFYNDRLGFVEHDNVPGGTFEVGDDAWVGERAIITPSCKRIGIGAVVGSGAVVTKDVPDFAIVAGNPARLIRYRFESLVREQILASRWWDRPVEECARHMTWMTRPLDDPTLHPLIGGEVEDQVPSRIVTPQMQGIER